MDEWTLIFLAVSCLGFFLYVRSLCNSKFFGNLKPYPANPPFDFTKVNTVWDDIYLEGNVRARKQGKNNNRRRRRYVQILRGELKGDYAFALVTWRCMNPDYVIAPDDEVHHVDFDSLNDCYENLRLLSHEQHLLIHQRHENLTRKPLGLPIFNNALQEQLLQLHKAI
jgi:hypothetical protein